MGWWSVVLLVWTSLAVVAALVLGRGLQLAERCERARRAGWTRGPGADETVFRVGDKPVLRLPSPRRGV